MKTDWNERFLDMAQLVSTWSKDPSTQVGAVTVDPIKRIVLSTGYNGFPRGIEDDGRLDQRSEKLKLIIHGEMNAIFNATYSGVSLNNSHLFVYGLPVCSQCAKGIVQVGISNVWIRVADPEKCSTGMWAEEWNSTKKIFNEAGVTWYGWQ